MLGHLRCTAIILRMALARAARPYIAIRPMKICLLGENIKRLFLNKGGDLAASTSSF